MQISRIQQILSFETLLIFVEYINVLFNSFHELLSYLYQVYYFHLHLNAKLNSFLYIGAITQVILRDSWYSSNTKREKKK